MLKCNQFIYNGKGMTIHQSNQIKTNKPLPSRGIYLLPNLLTTAGLFAGFYSIVAAMKGMFDVAATAILVAMITDGLDGRVARLTNTQSEFGAEYDSLADMVAFGIAPALVVYSWALSHLGKIGWLAAFLYAAATALRLARFNTQVHETDGSYFQGLPSPTAAGVVASIVWLGSTYNFTESAVALPVAAMTIVVAGLMVSTISYNSFKHINLKGKVSFFTIVGIVLVLAAVAIAPPQVLFAIFTLYAISGPALCVIDWRKRRRTLKSLLKR
jgi:CDP-diacylglycerol--serine O-phosphatidyltransferase